MYSIAVMGYRKSVIAFKALGFDVYPVESSKEAANEIKRLAETDCAIIFLTEQIAVDIPEIINKYKDELKPAIIMIPGKDGSLGIGKTNIQHAIERAVGADIL